MKNIKILGYNYEMHYSLPRYKGGMDASGCTNSGQQIIIIDPLQCKQSQESTMLHEILEALNTHMELSMDHRTISCLEVGLFQVFKDNGINIGRLLKNDPA